MVRGSLSCTKPCLLSRYKTSSVSTACHYHSVDISHGSGKSFIPFSTSLSSTVSAPDFYYRQFPISIMSSAAVSAAATAAATIAAAESAVPTWDAGVTAPYEVSTEDDQRGFLTVMTATALSFVLVGFIIRTYVRFTVGGFKTDDWILTTASILAIVQSALVFSSMQKGFGLVSDLVAPEDFVPMLKVRNVYKPLNHISPKTP